MIEAGLGEATESNRLDLENSLSRRGGGGDRVVPKSPVTGAYRPQMSSYPLAVPWEGLKKILSFPRACPEEATAPTVATCTP